MRDGIVMARRWWVLACVVAACSRPTRGAPPTPEVVRVTGGPCTYQHVEGTCRLLEVTQRPAVTPGEIVVVGTYATEHMTPPNVPSALPFTFEQRAYPDTFARMREYLQAHAVAPCDYEALTSGTCGTMPPVVHVPRME